MANVKLTLGYDTERPYGKLAETDKGREFRLRQIAFVKKMSDFLNLEQVPRTHFILGNYLERCLDSFTIDELSNIYDKNNPLMELQQHSYSHLIFRETQEKDVAPVSPQEFIKDIKKAKDVIYEITGAATTGLRTPRGYEKDLSDMPAILEGLESLGFFYVSSNLRSKNSIDGPFISERQPHNYGNVGYPNIAEMPVHGWQDAIFTPSYGNRVKFLPEGKKELNPLEEYSGLFDKAEKMAKLMGEEKSIYISLCMHPWCMMEWDENLEIHKRIIDSARNRKIEIMTYGKAAKEIVESKLD